MNNKQINDWRPEVLSLLGHLRKRGLTIVKGDNGEDQFKYTGPDNEIQFVEQLVACDEAHLFVLCPDKKVRWIYLVLGNSPGELCSDYLTGSAIMDIAIEACAEEWAGRPQPQCGPRVAPDYTLPPLGPSNC